MEGGCPQPASAGLYVPAPIVGAGLPVLAVLGGGYWLIRIAILKRLPDALKRQSVITKLLNGSREFRYSAKTTDYSSHKTIDGIDIGYPLFQSDKFGYKLFYDGYIARAQMPRSYVLLHPNWSKLENVFKEMGDLARSFGFDVTVILAPTADRFQGKYFDGFPKTSDEPFFLELVGDLAVREKFRVVNLFESMRKVANQQLLYFRDDDHWNEDGHRLVAKLLSEKLSEWHSAYPSGVTSFR